MKLVVFLSKTVFFFFLTFSLCGMLTVNHAYATNAGNFSVGLWVKPASSVVSKVLVGKAEELRVFTNAGGFAGCQVKASTWQTAAQAITKALTVGTWSQVICTYDLAKLTVYVNGVQVGQTTLTAVPDDTANVLKIGQDDSSATPYGNLAGTVDNFKFYNFALTPYEVKTEYNLGVVLQLGTLSTGSSNTASATAGSQEYCIPGDSSPCTPPVGRWDFEEGKDNTCTSGGTTDVCDSSGNGNNGSWSGTGSPHWTIGKFGKAGKFNGSDDYVYLGINSTLDVDQGPFTYEVWLRATSTSGGRSIFGRRLDSTHNLWIYLVANQMSFNEGGLNDLTYYPSFTIADGVWRHYAFVYNLNSNSTVLYINGVNVKEVSQAGMTPGDIPASSGTYLGSYISGAYFTQGNIDDARVFNYARTPAQIAWDYNRGAPVAQYKFDECTGTVAHDSGQARMTGSSAYNGTISIGATLPQSSAGTCTDGLATSAWYNGRTGRFNSSINLDGIDDYVNQPTSISGVQSVGFWVKPATTSQSFLQLSATATVTSSAGAVSAGAGFSSPTIYVNGKTGGTITASAWNHIVVTTAIGITANAIKLGLVGASTYYSGQIDQVQIYKYALTLTQVKTLYNGGSSVRF